MQVGGLHAERAQFKLDWLCGWTAHVSWYFLRLVAAYPLCLIHAEARLHPALHPPTASPPTPFAPRRSCSDIFPGKRPLDMPAPHAQASLLAEDVQPATAAMAIVPPAAAAAASAVPAGAADTPVAPPALASPAPQEALAAAAAPNPAAGSNASHASAAAGSNRCSKCCCLTSSRNRRTHPDTQVGGSSGGSSTVLSRDPAPASMFPPPPQATLCNAYHSRGYRERMRAARQQNDEAQDQRRKRHKASKGSSRRRRGTVQATCSFSWDLPCNLHLGHEFSCTPDLFALSACDLIATRGLQRAAPQAVAATGAAGTATPTAADAPAPAASDQAPAPEAGGQAVDMEGGSDGAAEAGPAVDVGGFAAPGVGGGDSNEELPAQLMLQRLVDGEVVTVPAFCPGCGTPALLQHQLDASRKRGAPQKVPDPLGE